jgi:DNA-binding IclR family transcriptional regulator
MTPATAGRVHGALVAGYRSTRFDDQATPDWCRDVLHAIDDLEQQLKTGGHHG